MLYIQDAATFGDVIRGIHVWTAYLVVITSVIHLGRIFVTASYKRPREVNWLVGLALLGLLLSMQDTKRPVFFYWLYEFEDWFGVNGIFYADVAFFGLLALLPFADRTPLRRLTTRPVVAAFGLVVLAMLIALSITVAIQPPAYHLG